jgi:A/G-specific adenine glycosylase
VEAPKSVTLLRRALLAFYRKHARDLPWRRTRDPYAIWVSEVMLQQTQVQTAVPRFADFLRQFPTISALATTDERAVCEAWAGLGYYRRARNLHKAARIIVAELDGTFPTREEELRKLPGVGAYTAAAIASIAFAAKYAAVDGNLVRVLARVFALPGRADDPALVRAVRAQAQILVDCERPGEINQALMDIGATLCRPSNPACHTCPLRRFCRGFREGDPTLYPGKKVRAVRKSLHIAFAWIENKGALLLEQRPLDGLWPGLWELPGAGGARAKRELEQRLGQGLGPPLAKISHALTHRQVSASVYRATAKAQPGQKWWKDPLAAPLSSLARKAILEAIRRQKRSATVPFTKPQAASLKKRQTI